MPSSILRHPSRTDENSQIQPEREFDRWRTAVELVQRLREAGIDCEVSVPFTREYSGEVTAERC